MNNGCQPIIVVSLDTAREEVEARFDGKYVLCSNTTLPAAEVAVQYKRLYLIL